MSSDKSHSINLEEKFKELSINSNIEYIEKNNNDIKNFINSIKNCIIIYITALFNIVNIMYSNLINIELIQDLIKKLLWNIFKIKQYFYHIKHKYNDSFTIDINLNNIMNFKDNDKYKNLYNSLLQQYIKEMEYTNTKFKI